MSWQVLNADQLQSYYNNQQLHPYNPQPASTVQAQPYIIQLRPSEPANQHQPQPYTYNPQPASTVQAQPQIIQLRPPEPANQHQPQPYTYNPQPASTVQTQPQIIQLRSPEPANQQHQYQPQQQSHQIHHHPSCQNRQANPWDMNPHPGTEPNIVWPMNQNPFMKQGGAAPWPNYNQQSLVPQVMAGHGLPGNHMTNQPTAGPQVHTSWYQGAETPSVNSNNSAESSGFASHPYQYNINRNQSSETAAACPCCGHTASNSNQNIQSGYDNTNGNTFNQSQATSSNNYSTTGGHGYNPIAQRNLTNNHMSQLPINPYMDNYMKQLTQMGLQSRYQQAMNGGQSTQSKSLSGCCPPHSNCNINQIQVPPLPVPPPVPQQQRSSKKHSKSNKNTDKSPPLQQKSSRRRIKSDKKVGMPQQQTPYYMHPPDPVNNAYLMSMERMREMQRKLQVARAGVTPIQPPVMPFNQFQKDGQSSRRGGSTASAASTKWDTQASSFRTT